MSNRIEGYDLIRSWAVLIVFLGHILEKQATHGATLLAVGSLSPDLTMSLLGFISAALLTGTREGPGAFLIRRCTRIYIPLLLCLSVVLVTHALLGKHVISQHTLLHLMGLSLFFQFFLVENKSTVGMGLWFITAIMAMYVLLPALIVLFRHRHGLIHLVVIVLGFTAMMLMMYDDSSLWNVAISFSLGVYLSVNGRLEPLLRRGIALPALAAAGMLTICALSRAQVLPHVTRALLFPFYPLAFVPLFFALAKWLPKPVTWAVCCFVGLSYEFYILHFYVINERFRELFGGSVGLPGQIAISFAVAFALAYVLSAAAAKLRRATDAYLLAS